MLTSEEEHYILSRAYVPEHIVVLMTTLSGGEPFLIDDYFCCRKEDWIVFIGYPLAHAFSFDEFEAVLEKIKKKFRPSRISLIAPELSQPFGEVCRERQTDDYYTLDSQAPVLRGPVRRNLKKAARRLTVERSAGMGDVHQELMHEFVKRVRPPARVKELLFKMPQYVAAAHHCLVLNAWDSKNKLAAFYLVDLAAHDFANYIIGCYSKENYVLGASDLLLYELIRVSAAHDKHYIHLGLGVNDGIRRFKEKWGARPTRCYEMCELVFKKSLILEAVKAICEFRVQVQPPRPEDFSEFRRKMWALGSYLRRSHVFKAIR